VTPSARLSAAIEVLDRIQSARAPADDTLKAWGRSHRFAGSKDRRAIADLVYQALRGRARSEWRLGSGDGRSLILGAYDGSIGDLTGLFTGSDHAPAPLTAEERSRLSSPDAPAPDWVQAGVPAWLAPRLASQFGEDWILEGRCASVDRAPVDLRVNGLCGSPENALGLFKLDDAAPEPTPYSLWGLRLPAGFSRDVQGFKAFATGWVEVQDEASQVAAWLARAAPGELVVDYCAGAGGKTLALAACLRARGRLIASDVENRRLNAMAERASRARAKVETRLIGPAGEGLEDLTRQADLVFVDAPCSGSGTWRRRPEAAWRLTPETLDRLAALQQSILAQAAKLVRIGGRLVYATCSLFEQENHDVARRFGALHPAFVPIPVRDAVQTPNLRADGGRRLAALAGEGHTIQLTPRRTHTDGFFVALYQRTS
jgi:16S rRNA (cytosine967-C5)-methyltransferase